MINIYLKTISAFHIKLIPIILFTGMIKSVLNFLKFILFLAALEITKSGDCVLQCEVFDCQLPCRAILSFNIRSHSCRLNAKFTSLID